MLGVAVLLGVLDMLDESVMDGDELSDVVCVGVVVADCEMLGDLVVLGDSELDCVTLTVDVMDGVTEELMDCELLLDMDGDILLVRVLVTLTDRDGDGEHRILLELNEDASAVMIIVPGKPALDPDPPDIVQFDKPLVSDEETITPPPPPPAELPAPPIVFIVVVWKSCKGLSLRRTTVPPPPPPQPVVDPVFPLAKMALLMIRFPA
jgi:hypothetical protein